VAKESNGAGYIIFLSYLYKIGGQLLSYKIGFCYHYLIFLIAVISLTLVLLRGSMRRTTGTEKVNNFTAQQNLTSLWY
jgi:hypothetical protein